MPRFVIPQVHGRAAGQPERRAGIAGGNGNGEEPAHRLPQGRHRQCVAVGNLHREAAQEQVGGIRRSPPQGRFQGRTTQLRPAVTESTGADDHSRGERVEVGIAGERCAQRFEPPSRLQQQQRCLAPAAGRQHGPCAEPLKPSPCELVKLPGVDGRHHGVRVMPGDGVVFRLGAGEQQPRPAPRVGGQRGGALKKGGCRGRSAAGLGPAGRALKLIRHNLIRAEGGVRTVPHSAVNGRAQRRSPRPGRRARPAGRRRAPTGRSQTEQADA